MNSKRVLLKLSGEALADKNNRVILEAFSLDKVAESIKMMSEKGMQIGVVVGAGNIWRGNLAESIGIERSTADYMGMLATIINALALQSALMNIGVDCRVCSAIEVRSVAEYYIRRKAIRHLEKGRVVVFAGGTGNPYFTTDTCAALRAMEIEASEILMAKNGVDGVYSADPRVIKDAQFIKRLTFSEMLSKDLKVMDPTAVALLKEQAIAVRVFNMNDINNIKKLVNGEDVGTVITKGE